MVSKVWRKTVWGLLGVATLAWGQEQASATVAMDSPTQLAFFQVKVKQARLHFARRVSVISGVSSERVLRQIPDDWRAGDPRYTVIPYLEKVRHASLGQAQKKEIEAADQAMKAEVARARQEALAH